MSGSTLVSVAFTERARASEALSSLRTAARDGRLDVRAAAVLRRTEDGRLEITDGDAEPSVGATVTGGLIGTLVGVLGGPLGMLLGLGAGALIGGMVDADRTDESDSALAAFARSIGPGAPALLAEVEEFSPEFLDERMAALGGQVLRRRKDDVLAEVDRAARAEVAARREADAVLTAERPRGERETPEAV